MQEEHNNIDEQVFFVRKYRITPPPPHKWEFKIFSTNRTNGEVYDFDKKGSLILQNPMTLKDLVTA